jgi:lipopolysaccharide transport system permease protein
LGIYQPFSFLWAGWRHRQLIVRFARRRVQSRYRGSVLGGVWLFIQPLLMLAVYTFVFSVVFEARWGPQEGGQAHFALFLFSGIILYTIFSECVNEAPGLVLNNETYVKQLRFPLEIFPWVSVCSSLFTFLVSSLVLMAFYGLLHGLPSSSAIFLPLVILPVLLLTLGASWFLSSIGVFFRDVSQVTGIATTALLFLSPIFYPASRVPEELRDYYFLNPFATILEMFRGALFQGVVPDGWVLLWASLGAWAVAWMGYVWFMRTQKGFADVV